VGVEGCAIQRKGILWLLRKFGGKEMRTKHTQFVSMLTVGVVVAFDCGNGISDDTGTASVGARQDSIRFCQLEGVFLYRGGFCSLVFLLSF
jgi:hypothetical protein